jgi:uncharacterized protein YegP (UPF0339 family)
MAGKAHFEVYPERRASRLLRKQWRWRLQAANGRIDAVSGEGFTRPEDAERACTAVAETVAAVEWVGPKGSAVAVERVDS